ncbi:hypothetical protein [Cryobacterium tagatosivorans]|uniref:hypothetical protein n=1 Tax=Cryobacterium tagatosivorans TaxID=1259199 RepID=UPI00141B2966|nr:hypothetical protein [Cryobacterium tagatosivorans]
MRADGTGTLSSYDPFGQLIDADADRVIVADRVADGASVVAVPVSRASRSI